MWTMLMALGPANNPFFPSAWEWPEDLTLGPRRSRRAEKVLPNQELNPRGVVCEMDHRACAPLLWSAAIADSRSVYR